MAALFAALLALASSLTAAVLDASSPAVRAPALEVPASAHCPEWWGPALEAGWPPAEMPTLDRVMWCESRCRPDATNPSGARGLMQVLARYFPAGADPLEPATNLAQALEVWHAQGWRGWTCY